MTHDAATQIQATQIQATQIHAAQGTHHAYGTCSGCQQLKHVTAEGLVRDHNRYEATGTVVLPYRCSGSGNRYQEAS